MEMIWACGVMDEYCMAKTLEGVDGGSKWRAGTE